MDLILIIIVLLLFGSGGGYAAFGLGGGLDIGGLGAMQMSETVSVNLQGKNLDVGPVHFLRAEWQDPRSRFVVLRVSIDNNEVPTGLRMDLDKVAILDDLSDNAEINNAIKQRARLIWDVVIEWRRQHHETYV